MIQAYFTYDRYSPGQYIIVNVNRINGAEFSESNQSLKKMFLMMKGFILVYKETNLNM